MKVPFNRKKLYQWIIVQVLIYSGCLLFSYKMGASNEGMPLLDYLQIKGLPVSLYAFTTLLLFFDGFLLSGVKEYHIDESGIALVKVLGKTKTIKWEGLAFVGPAYVGYGRFRHKSILFSYSPPRKGNEEEKPYVIDEKNSYSLQDSPEMRDALKLYCPVYTEMYEDLT